MTDALKDGPAGEDGIEAAIRPVGKATPEGVGGIHDAHEPHAHIGFLIRRAQQLHVAVWSRVVSTEISSVQYSILVTLDRLGEASQRELCDEAGLDRSTIAEILRRMERNGLIERQRSAVDARRNTVRLTAHGLAERIRLRPLVKAVQQELTTGLSAAERAQLEHGLKRLLESPVAATRIEL
ncbi:MarR family winged helix-turn-helix transcriptional regulator [Leucobacter sp. Z1108]|uniref:MarR family winged helix-turn-helix transcriptional regulator n=1 Tax=Leucobacter sp. Z1108 TaxID=3439066 RepID=UPI003F4173A8